VLLKQPGAVPAGAGGEGCIEEFAPLVWHSAQTEALLGSVFVWVRAPPRQGAGAWGAFTPWQEKQDDDAMPPWKSVPWQDWQAVNPFVCVFAAEP
jgi:hypothetical protein